MFETFDIKSFGKYLKDLRISMSFTQKDIVKLSGISIDSLRRIETGTVLPRYDTLATLSLAYKKDLLNDLKSYRNSNILFEYYARLDNIILKYNLEALDELEKDFNEFTKNQNDEILLNTGIREQFLLIIKGINIVYSEQCSNSLQYFIRAMRISIPSFTSEECDNFNYTHFETRILFLIAVSLGNQRKVNLSNKLLIKCLELSNLDIDASNKEKFALCKLYFQLSYNSHRLDEYENALKYSQDGIEYCNKHNITYMLAGLLYRKSIAEYRLNIEDHVLTLKKSISILLITNNEKLAEIYIKTAKDMYGIEINLEDL